MNNNPVMTGESNFPRELGLVIAYATAALDALKDEHEGNFKFYVTEMFGHASITHNAAQEM